MRLILNSNFYSDFLYLVDTVMFVLETVNAKTSENVEKYNTKINLLSVCKIKIHVSISPSLSLTLTNCHRTRFVVSPNERTMQGFVRIRTRYAARVFLRPRYPAYPLSRVFAEAETIPIDKED